ncbi:MAG: stage V sporulation T C-terminal domain-containing protein [Oscillospiraceae bacterium]|nr:stage V sporulation T C-terminal domain-containing protein [Oscillospiraceae bacterium]
MPDNAGLRIAGYCRISVDDELDRDNVSIENQKAIIRDFVGRKFPGAELTFFEDRDRSGYTFEQREGYQAMRRELMAHRLDILVIKDFSRFSRRNSRGLVELEDLRDAGVRIISIGDAIDFPNDDDWLKIQFQFLINEMPVTDTSKKVKSVIRRRQEDGKWICAAPYGYIVNKKQQFEVVPVEAEIVRRIYRLYIDGWGYKKIANTLTDEGIPTPRMAERERKIAEGEEYRRSVKSAWSIATVQGILDNDFYIGTLRQGKYTRAKINGRDILRDEVEQIVIENHHQPIIDYRTFATVRALREKRAKYNYRGVKINENVYSGFLECGDCGAPMFALSRRDLKPAYTCGTYHRRGTAGCTTHHIRVDKLDELVKLYVRKVRDNSAEMLERLNAELAREPEDVAETERSAANLEDVLLDAQEELKATKRQRVRDIMRHPENEAVLDETYDELEADLMRKIEGLQSQIERVTDRRNTMIRTNRAAKTAMEVFDDIIGKEKLEKQDLELIIERIKVYEDHVEIQLKADIDTLLRRGELPEPDTEPVTVLQTSTHHPDRAISANVVSEGDPLEIFTDKDGEVIFKKYSPIGELSDFAAQICDSLHKSTDCIAAVCDRDAVIAVAGGGRRELFEKRVSPELEQIMESRRVYRHESGGATVPVTDSESGFCVSVAAPVISEGDLMGCVIFASPKNAPPSGDVEFKLAQTVAAFLGKQMES